MRTCFAGSVSNADIKLASMPFCERICQPTLRRTERAAPAILQQTGKRDSYQAMASAIAKQYHYPAWRPLGRHCYRPKKTAPKLIGFSCRSGWPKPTRDKNKHPKIA